MSEPRLQRFGNVTTIHDPDSYPDFEPGWFDRDWWLANGARSHGTTGRAPVLMLDRENEGWVYRHYHRGGFVARLIYDQYLWSGVMRSRPMREWKLLDRLASYDLPAPRPVAARTVRTGFSYRADILTVLLPDTRPLSSMLGQVWGEAALWSDIGRMLAGFHKVGCDHPDLTAHNILVNSELTPWLVDFDNAHIRPPGNWAEAGIARFQRSLRKVSLETGTTFEQSAWEILTRAYSDALA